MLRRLLRRPMGSPAGAILPVSRAAPVPAKAALPMPPDPGTNRRRTPASAYPHARPMCAIGRCSEYGHGTRARPHPVYAMRTRCAGAGRSTAGGISRAPAKYDTRSCRPRGE